MSERIPLRYTVALLGFGDAERDAFAPFFRLAAARTPVYAPAATLAEADFVVVDGDKAGAVAELARAGRLSDGVTVGGPSPSATPARLERPIEPTHVVRELDLLLEQRLSLLDGPSGGDWVASEPGGLADARAKDVLVVDDSRVALRFMQVRLQQRGYRVHVAATPEEALERLAHQPFAMVFLDVVLGPRASMDGLALCQRIKQGRHAPTAGIPRVAFVTGLSSSSDRVRGELAGCDAYLTKPLMEDDLRHALQVLDPAAAPA